MVSLIGLLGVGCGGDEAGTATVPATEPIDLPAVSPVTSLPSIENPSTVVNTAPPNSAFAPDIIFYGGVVLTMNPAEPTAEAVAVLDDLIEAVGSNDEVLALRNVNTQLIDLEGRTVMPGFVDTHTHIFNDAASIPGVGNLETAQQMLLQNGITTVADLYVTRDFLTAMRAMDDAGRLRVRTSLYLSYTTPCGEVLGDWYREFPPTRVPGEMLRIGGVKLFADGGSCGYPAISHDVPEHGEGNLWFTQDQLNAMVADIDAAGYPVAIHAVGDRAVAESMSAIEFALAGRPNVLRHHITHAHTMSPDLVPRFQESGVGATVTGTIYSCSIGADSPADPAWNFPYRALLDAGPDVHVAWHTDFPWRSLNPLVHLYSLVTPFEIGRDLHECADPKWVGDKTITLDEALHMMTSDGAYALFRENEVGSLEPGKYADLVVLSADPAANLDVIKNIEVWMTMVGGHVEWCAPGHEGLCPTDSVEGPMLAPFSFRVRISTTSDWATLTLLSGGTLSDQHLVSASAEATRSGGAGSQFYVNQTIARANSGASVELVMDVTVSARAGAELAFLVESGAIGDTTITLFNTSAGSPVEVATVVLHETSMFFNTPVSQLAPS